MKVSISLFIVLFSTLGCLTHAVAQTQNNALKIPYTIYENDLVPEGIAYDPVDHNFYVSSTFKRKIIKISANGKVSNFTQEGQDGLLGVVGMRVDAKRRMLWAASSNVGIGMPIKGMDQLPRRGTGIHQYDLTTGKLVQKYMLDTSGEQTFLNDLVVALDGTVYVTNTSGQAIYKMDPKNRRLELFLQMPEGHRPNGIDITPDNKYLFVTMYNQSKGAFGRIDIAAKRLSLIDLPDPWQSGADGLYYYQNSLIAILPKLDGTDKIVRYFLDASQLKVVDAKFLINGNPLLSQATTGVVIRDRLFFIATSNLQLFRKEYEETKGNVNPKELPPVRIGMVRLEEKKTKP
jgi:Gluconolactonase